MGSSAKSIWRYGTNGNGTAARASVNIAASAAKTAAPAKVTVKFLGLRLKPRQVRVANYQEKRFYSFLGADTGNYSFRYFGKSANYEGYAHDLLGACTYFSEFIVNKTGFDYLPQCRVSVALMNGNGLC